MRHDKHLRKDNEEQVILAGAGADYMRETLGKPETHEKQTRRTTWYIKIITNRHKDHKTSRYDNNYLLEDGYYCDGNFLPFFSTNPLKFRPVELEQVSHFFIVLSHNITVYRV